MKIRTLTFVSAITLLASLVVPTLCAAPLPKATLSPSGTGAFQFGFNVAIGGSTVAVYGGDGIYVYSEPAGGWTSMTQTAKLTASDGANLFSVAVAGNGSVIAAGSYLSGEAFVFVEPAGGWTDMTETGKLTPSDAPIEFFGFSAAVNLDGTTIVVGAPENNSIGAPRKPDASAGAAYVFKKTLGGWKSATETAKLTASDGVAGDDLGWSVGTQGDAIVAGAPNATIGANSDQGALYVFVNPSLNWFSTTQTAKLSGADGSFGALGQSVSISSNTILAGGFGLAYIFARPTTGWANATTQTAQLTDSGGRGACSGGCFGLSVSLWDKGALVGAPGYETSPISVVDLFIKQTGGWANENQSIQLHAPSDFGHGSYGYSVAAFEQTYVVGYPDNTLTSGYGNVAFVY